MPADPATLHRRAVQATAGGRPELARTLLREAALLADSEAAAAALRGRILVSLAHAEAEVGDAPTGLALLDRAWPLVHASRHDTGLWFGQRGLILLRAAAFGEARAAFDRAVPLLSDDAAELARCLLNRGVLALRQGDLAAGERDFARCLVAAGQAGLDALAAKARGNAGYLAYLRGDLPAALAQLQEAADALGGQPGPRANVLVDRGRALIAAGLSTEAEQTLRRAVTLQRRAGLVQDEAEAELTRAEVALAVGEVRRAGQRARRARALFQRRGAAAWVTIADLLLARAQLDANPGAAAEAAARLASRLAESGLPSEVRLARAVEAAGATATGDLPRARRALGAPGRTTPSSEVATRLLAREAQAALLVAEGRRAAAQRFRWQALTEHQRYQARFGSLDLQTAATGVARRLAEDGLGDALAHGRADQVLRWSELSRATSSRIVAVRPAPDAGTAERLAELRHLRSRERDLQRSGLAPPPDFQAAARRLEREIRERAWTQRGTRLVEAPATLEQVRSALPDDAAVVSFVQHATGLFAQVIRPRRARLRHLADARRSAALREHLLRLRADLDAAAVLGLPQRLQQTVAESTATNLRVIEDLLSLALQGIDPGGPVAIIPTGALFGVPWPMLDRFAGRAVTVIPSATWWLAARSRPRPAGGAPGVFVAGPDVARAEDEVRACSAGVRSARLLTGSHASAQAVLQACDGAGVLHVAAHGRHEQENPLFSALLVGDGWLFGYDLSALSVLPRHVVLSACETGLASVRAGDEALGMTAALLHAGTASVVAAVSRVADEVAARVGIAHHRGLRAGLAPAAALAAALTGDGLDRARTARPADRPTPLVCFGAGW